MDNDVVIMGLLPGARLGNHLFSFAVGHALARRHRSQLFFYDEGHFGRDSYPLAQLVGPRFRLATPGQLLCLGIYDYPTPLRHTVSVLSLRLAEWRASRSHRLSVVTQQSSDAFEFDPKILELPPPILLNGYFQSLSYFDDYADEIAAQIQLPTFEGVLPELPRPRVAITFRRGDYVNYGWNLPLDYYDRALERCLAQVQPGSFVLFSDDPEFVQLIAPRIEPYGPTVQVPRWTRDPLVQLSAMVACDHHILANSTYCWWGAWLAEQRTADESLVIAPSGWLTGDEAILPDHWVRVPVGSPSEEPANGDLT